jgi:hypothetical protein
MPSGQRRTAPPPPGPARRHDEKGPIADPAPTPPDAAKPTARQGDISSGVPSPELTPPPRELPEGIAEGNKGFVPGPVADRFPTKRRQPKREAED